MLRPGASTSGRTCSSLAEASGGRSEISGARRCTAPRLYNLRGASRIIERAWKANPHPDLAETYANIRFGDSARDRLARVETLAPKAPGDTESALAVAKAAFEAVLDMLSGRYPSDGAYRERTTGRATTHSR